MQYTSILQTLCLCLLGLAAQTHARNWKENDKLVVHDEIMIPTSTVTATHTVTAMQTVTATRTQEVVTTQVQDRVHDVFVTPLPKVRSHTLTNEHEQIPALDRNQYLLKRFVTDVYINNGSIVDAQKVSWKSSASSDMTSVVVPVMVSMMAAVFGAASL